MSMIAWLLVSFSVLMLLGDFLYRSNTEINCCRQVMDAYKECGRTLVAITEVALDRVAHYGIVNGVWEDTSETMMKVDSMVEKPTDDYAREYLGVRNRQGSQKYYATFGQYVLTPEVFSELELGPSSSVDLNCPTGESMA